jgi:hypothetical protein
MQLMALSREPQALDHLIFIAKNPAHADFLGAIQGLAQTGESRGAEMAASVLKNPQIPDDLKAELIRALQPNDQGAAEIMTPILLAVLDATPSGTLGSSAAESLWICLRLAPYGSPLRKTMIDRGVAIASDSKQSGNTRKTILNLLQEAPPSVEIVQKLKNAVAKERNSTLRKFMENALSWQEKSLPIWN